MTSIGLRLVLALLAVLSAPVAVECRRHSFHSSTSWRGSWRSSSTKTEKTRAFRESHHLSLSHHYHLPRGGSTAPPKRRRFFGFMDRSNTTQTFDNDEKEEEGNKTETSPEATKSKRKFRLGNKKSTEKEEQNPPDEASKPSHNTTKEAENVPTATPSSNTYSTKNESSSEKSTDLPSKSIIVMAPPGTPGGSPYHMMRPPTSGGRSPQQMQPSPATFAIAEMLGNALGLVIRLSLLSWLASKVSTEDETIMPTQRFVWERLNDRYVRDEAALKTMLYKPPTGLRPMMWRRRSQCHLGTYKPAPMDFSKVFQRTVVVLPFSVSEKGSVDLEFMSDVVTFLLQQHRSHAFGTKKTPPQPPRQRRWRRNNKDIGTDNEDDEGPPSAPEPLELEIVLLVESPGGSVTSYGLASAQVQRLVQEAGIRVTVCVDQIAASGGYMIASQAHHLIAAPFAVVGSIGVIMSGLNYAELAKRYGVKPFVIKAGTAKNPISTFGEISKGDERLERERLERWHDRFKELVVAGRPALKDQLEEVMDGSIFIGQEALQLNMVDDVKTSDEYILERVRAGDRVLRLHRSHHTRFTRRLKLVDLLPHLRTWIHDKVLAPFASSAGGIITKQNTIVALGFLAHLICSRVGPAIYGENGRGAQLFSQLVGALVGGSPPSSTSHM